MALKILRLMLSFLMAFVALFAINGICLLIVKGMEWVIRNPLGGLPILVFIWVSFSWTLYNNVLDDMED